jgi:hypothetical protein
VGSPALQVCQQGFDVRKCPDWAYLYNSDWPSLAIAFEKTITVESGNTGQPVDHNLGFWPLTVGYISKDGISYSRLPPSAIKVTKTKAIVTFNPVYTNVASVTVVVRCYNVDISKEAGYPLPQSAQAKLPYNDQFGIKFAKKDRAITSKNLNDFIIHSRAQSPAVLVVGTENGQYFKSAFDDPGTGTNASCIVYPLKTSYIPWIFGAIKTDADTYEYWSLNNISYVAASNTMILNIGLTGAGSLIVLRDPLFYPETVRVVY